MDIRANDKLLTDEDNAKVKINVGKATITSMLICQSGCMERMISMHCYPYVVLVLVSGSVLHPGGPTPVQTPPTAGNMSTATTAPPIEHKANAYSFITAWGTYGTGDGQFSLPDDVAVDSSDNVYVADPNNRTQKFDSNGTFITKWGTHGTGVGQFSIPTGVAVDSAGKVYVADSFNNRIQAFSPK